MNSTSLRSFSCPDWILSFVVFVSSCRFHHQKTPPKKRKKEKNHQKKMEKKNADLVSRSLLSLPFALLLLLVVCFRACLCAFAHHAKKIPSQKKLKNRKPRKKVHFCVLVTFLVLVECSCCSRPRPRHALLLFSFLFSSCVLLFSFSLCVLVAFVLCSRSAFVLCVLAVVLICRSCSAFLSYFRLSHVMLEVTRHVLLSLFSLRVFRTPEKGKHPKKDEKKQNPRKKVLISCSRSAVLSCFRLLHVALDVRLLISLSSSLLHTTKKKKVKRKSLKKQYSLACLFCSFVAVAYASDLFRSVLFGFWFLSEFWVSVLYLHGMYPINCLVYQGAWGGSYVWQRLPSLVSSVALFS
jgi:hypothetical protein